MRSPGTGLQAAAGGAGTGWEARRGSAYPCRSPLPLPLTAVAAPAFCAGLGVQAMLVPE